MDDFAEILGDDGNTPPSVSDAVEEPVSVASEQSAVSPSSSFEEILSAPEPQATDVAETVEEPVSPEKSEEPAAAEEAQTEEIPTDLPAEQPEEAETDEITDEAIDKALANPRTGKWFKNAITHQREQFTAVKAELEKFQPFGEPEQLEKLSDLHENLYGFVEVGGEFVSKAPAFALSLLEKEPDKAIELINTFMGAPNPLDPSQTVFDALVKAPEIEEYFKQQFAVSDEQAELLKTIPSELHAAYNNLPKEYKDEFSYAVQSVRDRMLADSNAQLAENQAKVQQIETARVEREQQINADIERSVETNFDTVLSGFDDSLRTIPFSPDKEINTVLQSGIHDLVMTAVTMAENRAGKQAAEVLKNFGVSLPGDASALVAKLEKDSGLLARAKFAANEPAARHYASEIATTQKALAGRANKVVADIAERIGHASKANAESANARITETKSRPAIAGVSGQPNGSVLDVSKMSWQELLDNE